MHIPLWENGVGGGMSTFTCSQYPVLNPLNVLAWFLNDGQFCIFHLIMPYAAGLFFTSLLLQQIFEISWPYALFGSLYYLGLGLSRYTILLESPLTLWGCFLLPGALYAYFKLVKKDSFLAISLVGIFLSFQFAASGATTFPQNFLWWICFLAVEFFLSLRHQPLSKNIKEKTICVILLGIISAGIFATQFIPTYEFVMHESGRHINTYPLGPSLLLQVVGFFPKVLFFPMGASMRGLWALIFMAIALVIAHPQKVFRNLQQREALLKIWLATGLYILMPTFLQILPLLIPCLKSTLAPLTMFTFLYAINTLDFCIAITLAVILGQEHLKLKNCSASIIRNIFIGILTTLAWILIILPLLFIIPCFKNTLQSIFLINSFKPFSYLSALLVFFTTGAAIICIIRRPSNRLIKTLLYLSLVVLGFMTTITCFNWNDKGQRTMINEYHFSSPEYKYFSQAQKKYFLPYDLPEEMGQTYGLEYGVYGTTGFYACAPIRFYKFMAAYHNGSPIPVIDFRIFKPSQALTTYFPIEFTTIRHGQPLPWQGFIKTVDGDRYDIYRRQYAPTEILFAHALKILSFPKIIKQFDTPFDQTIAVEDQDAIHFRLKEITLPLSRPSYGNLQNHQDKISFKVHTDHETLVMVPIMYQNGWKAWDNGKNTGVFAADYIFLGLRIPSGEHYIQLRFRPPDLKLGIILNIITLLMIIFLIIRFAVSHKSR
jgi:hypothetical protein